MSLDRTVTRELLRQHHACYYDQPEGEALVDALVPAEGLTPLELLALDIPAADRLWVATLPGVCPPAVMWSWQALLVERALARVSAPDSRSLAVVTLLRRLAAGENVPQAERDAAESAARNAAWAAWAASSAAAESAAGAAAGAARAAAESAARTAAWAAWAASSASAESAARAAEEQQQIVDLAALLGVRR
jgi:hypothetical protein